MVKRWGIKWSVGIPCKGRTEDDGVIRSTTRKSTRSIVERIAIRLGTRILKHLRVRRRPAFLRRPILPVAAILRATKRAARALTPLPVLWPQLVRAHPAQVSHAPGQPAGSRPAYRFHHHGQIVPIHKANVVEIRRPRPNRELGQCGRRRRASAVAFDLASAAIAGGAAAAGIEGATGSAPESAGPARLGLEGAGLVRGEVEAGGAEAGATGVGKDSGPDGVGALVCYGDCSPESY